MDLTNITPMTTGGGVQTDNHLFMSLVFQNQQKPHSSSVSHLYIQNFPFQRQSYKRMLQWKGIWKQEKEHEGPSIYNWGGWTVQLYKPKQRVAEKRLCRKMFLSSTTGIFELCFCCLSTLNKAAKHLAISRKSCFPFNGGQLDVR